MNRIRGIHPTKFIMAGLLIAACSMLAACAGKTEKEPQQTAFDRWEAMAESAKGHSPEAKHKTIGLPDRKLEGSESGSTQETQARPLPRRKITLKLQDTELTTVLRALARSVDLNLIISDKVSGKTSISVKDVRWDNLFKGILRAHGLTYTWEGDLIRILTLEDMEKDLKRANQKRDLKLTEPLLTRIVPVNFADEKKLKDNLEKFLTKDNKDKPIGTVLVDEHTKAIVIRAMADDMKQLIRLAEELDRPIAQVLIEAHIVETNKDTARELGVQWGGLDRTRDSASQNQFLTAGQNSTGVLGNTLGAAGSANPTSGMMSNFPATLADGQGLTIGYVIDNFGDNVLTMQLSALQEEGRLNILSSPSITTVDNQKAIIESGANVPYQTTTKEGNVNINWKDAVLRLEVSPHVIDAETIKLNIKTKKDELDFSRDVNGNPTIITKRAETEVILQDGETTVIGGLNKETDSNSEAGVPWLKDIPYLGVLFRGSSRSNEMEDVLIFITPHILKTKMQESQGEAPTVPETQDEPVNATPMESSDSSGVSSQPPPVLGRIAAQPGETLWGMVRTVYGGVHPSYMEAVLRVNPQIHDPEVIAVGEEISFPAIVVRPGQQTALCWWVYLDETADLANAFTILRAYPKHLPEARMVPYWSPDKGLRFALILRTHFFNEDAAMAQLEVLPPAEFPRKKLLSDWGGRTVFFADPYLVVTG